MSDILNGVVPTEAVIKGTLSAESKMSGTLNSEKGFDGESAFDIAVRNGFEGTEEEWLASLKGEKGDKGEQGEQGIGIQGEKGEKGDTGSSGVYVGSGDMPEDCNVQIDPNGEAYELPVWKTVLDTTLTAEQGGVTSLLLALSDAKAVANARRMRIGISYPQATALEANKAYLSVIMQDQNSANYNIRLISGHNVAASANATLFSAAVVEISDFSFNNTHTRSFVSVHQLPHPHYEASANSVANARVTSGGYPVGLIKSYPPYLKITNSAVAPFKAGAKVFVEVQQ